MLDCILMRTGEPIRMGIGPLQGRVKVFHHAVQNDAGNEPGNKRQA